MLTTDYNEQCYTSEPTFSVDSVDSGGKSHEDTRRTLLNLNLYRNSRPRQTRTSTRTTGLKCGSRVAPNASYRDIASGQLGESIIDRNVSETSPLLIMCSVIKLRKLC